MTLAVASPQILRIRIGGNAGANGNGTMVITCTPTPPCSADVTHDNTVNIDDLLFVVAHWGGGAGDPADVNGDNTVNIADLLAIVAAWGPCA